MYAQIFTKIRIIQRNFVEIFLSEMHINVKKIENTETFLRYCQLNHCIHCADCHETHS